MKVRNMEIAKLEDLPPKQALFIENMNSGMSKSEAYFAAGYMTDRNPDSTVDRRAANSAATILAAKPHIKQFLQDAYHVKPMYNERDVMNRLYLIATGNVRIAREVRSKSSSRKGKVVFEPPVFRDQIAAAGQLLSWFRYRDSRPGEKADVQHDLAEDLKKQSMKLLADVTGGNDGEDHR
ncbi:MAG: hypothetical protein ACQGQO_04570 [Sphaerochaetaceae bacterium]